MNKFRLFAISAIVFGLVTCFPTKSHAQFNTTVQNPITTWQNWTTGGPFGNQTYGYANGASYGNGYSSNYDCGLTVFAEGYANGADGTQSSSISSNGNSGVGLGIYGVKAGIKFSAAVCPNQLEQRRLELAQDLKKTREQQIVTFRGYCLERISAMAVANQSTAKIEEFCQKTITDMKVEIDNPPKK